MNHSLNHLAEQRATLVTKAATQREELTLAFSNLHRPLALADKGIQVLRFLGRHPMLVAGAVTVAAMMRPKRWFLMLENGWLAWRMAVAARRKLDN
jgi:hypothetical protein